MDKHPVLFVSLGPGEAELITLKGYRALQQADNILCPATIAPNGKTTSRAADILRQLHVDESKITLFPLPMNKDRTEALRVYGEMYAAAGTLYRNAARVVVVAEGDAGFYSSVHYVYDRLFSSGVPVRCVAGIPAFIACGAIAGLHIVQQDERLTVIPGNATSTELTALLDSETTVVIMKLSQCTDEVHRFITDNPCYRYHYFENAGTDREYYSTDVQELREKPFPYFSLMIIRKN